MKTRVIAKIGTHSTQEIVLWNDKEIKKGDRIFVMESEIYDQLHSSVRRVKSCQYWQRMTVTDTEPILFLSR